MSKELLLLYDKDKNTCDEIANIFNTYEIKTINDYQSFNKIREDVKASLIILNLTFDSVLTCDIINFSKRSGIPILIVFDEYIKKREEYIYNNEIYDFIVKPFSQYSIKEKASKVIQYSQNNKQIEKSIIDSKDYQKKIDTKTCDISDLITNAPAGLLILSSSKKHEALFINKTLFEMLGYTKEEFINDLKEDFMKLVYVYDAELLQDKITEAENSSDKVQSELRLKRKCGSVFWVEFFAINTMVDSQSVLYCIIVDKDKEKKEKIEIERTMSSLKFRANHDLLTGIYNRRAFYDATSKMILNSDKDYVIVRINIERFKVINELFGYDVGDKILINLGEGLSRLYEDIGRFARFDADHFVICIPKIVFNAEKLLEELEKATTFQTNYKVIFNFGIYEITDKTMSVISMCDRANMALQTIKGGYDKRYAYYDDKLRDVLILEQQITTEMYNALKEEQFVFYLQPVYSLYDKRYVSAEALIRWKHPEKGMLSPGVFIPLFEKNGFISKLDEYMLEKVCKYLNYALKNNKTVLPISVNISRRSLYNQNLSLEIESLANKYSIPHNLLKFEITESAYNDNPNQLLATIASLQKKGYQVLMDDFGSGYSSLNALKEIPVDILKIDMKFVGGFEKSSKAGNILTSVVRMAKWLKLPIIAEGVETTTQVEFLRSIGCNLIQGYYYSKPIPIDDFENVIMQKDIALNNTNIEVDNADFDNLFNGNSIINKIMNSMLGAIGIYEFTGERLEILKVNDNYFDIMGYTPEIFFIDSKNIYERFRKEDIKKSQDSCYKAYDTGHPIRLITEGFDALGNSRTYDCIYQYLGGSRERMIICIAVNDITKEAENNKDINKKQQLYEILIEETNSIVCDYDCINDVMFCSYIGDNNKRVSYNISNYSKTVLEGEAIHPNDRMNIYHLLTNNDNFIKNCKFLFQADYFSTGYKWYEMKCKYIADDDSKVYRIVGCAMRVENISSITLSKDLRPINNRIFIENLINERLMNDSNVNFTFLLFDFSQLRGKINTFSEEVGNSIMNDVMNILNKTFLYSGISGKARENEFITLLDGIIEKEELNDVIKALKKDFKKASGHTSIDVFKLFTVYCVYIPYKGRTFSELLDTISKINNNHCHIDENSFILD